MLLRPHSIVGACRGYRALCPTEGTLAAQFGPSGSWGKGREPLNPRHFGTPIVPPQVQARCKVLGQPPATTPARHSREGAGPGDKPGPPRETPCLLMANGACTGG